MSADICSEYASTLKDLTFNSKPHISMLTMLAEENSQYAPLIVKVIEAHLQKVKPEHKLPTLYLIDSIMKNVPNIYQPLFTQNVVSNFCGVFEKVDEKVRAQMYKLRQTWAEIFPNKKLYAIDSRVNKLDPAWPILAQPPQQPSIHLNPKFFNNANESKLKAEVPPPGQELQEEEMRKQLLAKQQELLKLQRQKLELELLQTQVLVEEQKRQLIMKEQQLRSQQPLPADIQNKLTLQQLTNVAALAQAVSQATPSSLADRINRKGITTNASIGATLDKRPDLVSVGAVDTTKPVISPFVANNKTIDVNTIAKQGIANEFSSKNESVPTSSVQKSSHCKGESSGGSASQSTVASVALAAGRSSLAALLVKPQGAGGQRQKIKSPVGPASGQSLIVKANHKAHASQKNVVSKQSPKKNFDMSDLSPGFVKSGAKESSSPKKRTQSPKKGKGKVENVSRNVVDKKASKTAVQAKKDVQGGASESGSSKTSPSKSSPNKGSKAVRGSPGRSEGPLDSRSKGPPRFSPMAPIREAHRSSHSRSRSPGRIDTKGRIGRPPMTNKRNPGKEKENNRKGADVGNLSSSYMDVDLRTGSPSSSSADKSHKHGLEPESSSERGSGKLSDGEPPLKKSKGSDDSEIDEIFGGKDQDYRQLMRPVPKLSPIGSDQQGWAQYKASRPDEFKNTPLRPRDNDPFGFGNHDLDLRQGGMPTTPSTPSTGPPTPRLSGPFSPGIGRDVRDPRMANRGGEGRGRNCGGSPTSTRFVSGAGRVDPRRGALYPATRETEPGIPRALMFDRGAEIMRQADIQLRSGQLSIEQHREIMEQLAKLFELQRMRHVQRETAVVNQHGGGAVGGDRGRRQPEGEPDTIVVSSESDDEMDLDERPLPGKRPGRGRKVAPTINSSPTPSQQQRSSIPSPIKKKFLKPNDADENDVPVRLSPSDRMDKPEREVKALVDESASPRMDRDERLEETGRARPLLRDAPIVGVIAGSPVREAATPIRDMRIPKIADPREAADKNQLRGSPKPTGSRIAPINTVLIDDLPREVLFVGGHSIVLLGEANDDPRLIAFRGPPQEVMFDGDDDKCLVRLGFKPQDVKEFELDGHRHTLRFGAPTREVVIDGVPYSAIFGGPPFQVQLNGLNYHVRLCGPTPEVYFGDETRRDLMALIKESKSAEARNDEAKPKYSPPSSSSKEPTASPVRWVTSTIGRDYDPREWKQEPHEEEPNRFHPRQPPFGRGRGGGGGGDWRNNRFPPDDQPPFARHERGGRPFRGDNRRGGHFHHRDYHDVEPWGADEPMRHDDFHLTRGGPPGRHHQLRGDREDQRHSPIMDEYYDNSHGNNSNNSYREGNHEGRPHNYYPDPRFGRGGGRPQGMPPGGMNGPRNRFDGPNARMGGPMPPRPMGHPPMQGMRFGGPPPPYGYPPGGPPPGSGFPPPPMHQGEFGFSSGLPPAPRMMQGMNQPSYPPPMVIPPLDVSFLFEKLVATGIIPKVANNPERPEDQNSMDETPKEIAKVPEVPEVVIQPVPLTNEGLRIKYDGVVVSLYFGIQCSSCGVRFTSEQTDKYAQHLDWHFRQNRREKDSVRKALSRKWHYVMQDWIQFEEIEDLEERARSFFELQASEEQGEGGADINSSVPAGEKEEDKTCVVCHEVFELYWDEEHEEWHFRDAARHEEKNYHPLCYEDYKEQLIKAAVEEEKARIQAETDRVAALKKEQEDAEAAEAAAAAAAAIKKEEPEAEPIVAEPPVNIEEQTVDEVAMVDTVVKAEPSDDVPPSAEPMETEQVTETTDGLEGEMEVQEMSVFNVLASSYSVPPLIGLDLEESAMDVDIKDECIEPDDNASTAPENVDGPASTDENVDAPTTTECLDADAIKKEPEEVSIAAGSEDVAPDSTTADVESTSEVPPDGSPTPASVRSLVPEQQDENELCAATQSIAIKQEPVESDERDLVTVGDEDYDDDQVAALVVESMVSEVCGDAPTGLEIDKDVAQECLDDPLHGEIVEKITWGSTEVLAAEPSSSSGEISDGGGAGDASSRGDPGEEEVSDLGNESDTEPRMVDGFMVMPPVNLGSEMSGLCSIM